MCKEVMVNQSVIGVCITDTCIDGIESLTELFTEFLLLDEALPGLGFCTCKKYARSPWLQDCSLKTKEFKRSDIYATMQSFYNS
jgi:hypothetical protein